MRHDSLVKPNDYIAQIFDNGGLLSRQFEGYQPRPGQIQLARAIDKAIQTGDNVLVEAPTGTGKSVGYLVPAAYHLTVGADDLLAARASSGDDDGFDPEDDQDPTPPPRAVIVTANIALQEQLITKDVPRLQSIVPWEFTAAIAKGRANYLCLHRFDETSADVLLDPIRDPEDRERWNLLAKWKETTKTGDLSELTFELSPLLRQKAAVSADDCIGKACSRSDECFSQRARLAVQNADLIVTNYHMLCSHLAFVNEFGRGILPRFDILVLDEAHALPDVARDFFGFRVSSGAIAYAVRLMASSKWKGSCPFKPQLRDDLMRATDEFFEDLRAYKNGPVYFARLKEPDPVDATRLISLLEECRDAQVGVASSNVDPERAEQLRKAARKCRIHAENIRRAMKNEQVGKEVNEVFYIEEHGKGVALCCKPVKVAGILQSTIWENAGIRATIATSATLAHDNGPDALGYFAEEVGADDAEQLVVQSPFKFDEQALLVIPSGLPDPKDRNFSELVAHVIAEAVDQADGRSLVLCTSYKTLSAAYDVLERRFGHRFTILRQGQAPRTQLIARFKEDLHSVLVGTKSFWEGVDVQGESLSCTIIDKIPFDSPDDPINDAMNEILGQKAFSEYAMPRASIALRQGFGRLIRSLTDRGVVVMCDKRLIEKPFGKTILRALPKTKMSRDINDIRAFLAEKR